MKSLTLKNLLWTAFISTTALAFWECTKAERDNPFDPGSSKGISNDTLNLLMEYNKDCSKELSDCIEEAVEAKDSAIRVEQQNINDEFFRLRINSDVIDVDNSHSQNIVGTSKFQLSGTIDPKNKLKVFDINDNSITTNSNRWAIILELEPGPNSVNILLFDDKSNQYELIFTITYQEEAADREPPVITYNIVNGDTVNLPNLKFDGNYSDRSEIKSIMVNGKAAELDEGEWYIYLNLNEGSNPVTIEATDNSPEANKFTDSINIFYSLADLKPPTINISNPSETDILNILTDVPVSGKAKDNSKLVSVTVNGVEARLAGGDNWSARVDLEDLGNNKRIIATARDEAGNESSDTILVGYDPTAGDLIKPRVFLRSHNSTTVYHDDINTLEFEITDESGIASVMVNGKAATKVSDSIYHYRVVFAQNTEVFEVITQDNSINGNIDTSSFTIRYAKWDTDKPLITLMSPSEEDIITNQTIAIRVSVRDESGIKRVLVAGNNASTVAGAANEWEANYTFNGRGQHKIPIEATDNPIGIDQTPNTQKDTITLTYDPTILDQTPPTVANNTSGSPQSNDTVWASQATFNFTAEDENGISAAFAIHKEDVDSLESLKIPATRTENGWSVTVPLRDDTNSIYLGAIDDSYNKNTNTILINVYQGVPLKEIRLTNITLTSENAFSLPIIEWDPVNTTNKNYTLELVEESSYASISPNKKEVYGLIFPSQGTVNVKCKVIPETNPDLAKEFSVFIAGGTD